MIRFHTARTRARLPLTLVAAALWLGCSDPTNRLTEPPLQPQFAAAQGPDIARAIAAQQRFTPALMRNPAIIGTAVGLLPNGAATVRVFVNGPNIPDLPATLDGVPVSREVTGLFMAVSDPTKRQRPAPIGFSVGHPDITAGTIGARTIDSNGNRFILSNNHVLANINSAQIGDPILQPGAYDGGTIANDQVATLSAFQPIDFSSNGHNLIDAAIALTTTNDVANSTPTDDGYGMPSASIFGDGNNDGLFDNKAALLNLPVTKYGRTTKVTQGTVTGINATVSICYEVVLIFCVRSASFDDQLIISPGTFSAGGDSGSLIVAAAGLNPVGLLFAGSSTETIANRIDLVLNHFGVAIDAGSSPPPTPVTDVALTGISAPSSVTEGDAANVVVTVRNTGNQDVTAAFGVTLEDLNDNSTIGTQNVSGLSVGSSRNLSFSWNTAGSSTGSHTLRASLDLADDNAGNNAATTTVTVNPMGTSSGLHVGDLDAQTTNDKKTWSAIVEVTVHDANHNVVQGAVVTGTWSPGGLASDECTTGELGGNGTCIFLFPGIRKNTGSVTFTVTSVTLAGETYEPSANHDPDGSSNGTTIVVIKP